MSKTGRRGRRAFTDEFKSAAVGLVQNSGKTVGRIAKDLDLTETALRESVRKAEQTAVGGQPLVHHLDGG